MHCDAVPGAYQNIKPSVVLSSVRETRHLEKSNPINRRNIEADVLAAQLRLNRRNEKVLFRRTLHPAIGPHIARYRRYPSDVECRACRGLRRVMVDPAVTP